jgi:hypothetical protein
MSFRGRGRGRRREARGCGREARGRGRTADPKYQDPHISGLEAEIKVFPVWRPPSLKTDFRLHQKVFAMAPLSFWNQKMGG